MLTKISVKFSLISSYTAAGMILPPRSAPVDL
jgi:hypothetical protein